MNSRPDDLNFNDGLKNEALNKLSQDQSMDELISAFRQDVHEQAQRPAWFWAAQRATIRQHTLAPHHGSLGWALGSVFTVAAIAAALLFNGPVLNNPATQAQKVDDDLLMRQVVEATEGTIPDALAPATLLANEVDRGLKTAVQAKGVTR